MRVLHVINGLGSGGAENLLYNMLPLMNKEHEVELLILTKDNNLYYNELTENIRVHVSPYKGVRNIKHIKYIRKIIKEGNFDVVHGHLFPVMYFLPIALRRVKPKPKLIFTEHNTSNNRRRFGFRLMENYIYSKYDRIITISKGTNDELKKWLYNNKHNKLKIVENGIPIEKFQNAIPYKPRELIENYKSGDVLLLMVGRFSEQKDQDTIIKTLELLPSNYKLILVGEGSRKEQLQDLSRKLGLEERISFLGVRDDVDRITKTVDICIVSSHWEGFGLVAVEGMAAGKPVIGSNVEGLRDVISDKRYLFNVSNYKELSKSIINVSSHKKTSDLYVKYSRRFSLDNMLEGYLGVYTRSYE